MRDPSGDIVQAIYDAINGNVTYNSVTIPVYVVPVAWEDRTCDQYIRIAEVRFTEDGAKDLPVAKGSIDLYVTTFFTGKNEGSKVPMNSISNQVTQLIDQVFSLTNPSNIQVSGRISDIEDLDYNLDPQGVVFEKLITHEFIISIE